MITIADAKALAIQYHGAQVDKAGAPYIRHLQRVAANVSGTDAKIVALLHDILEDTDCTPKVLLELGYDQYIVDAVIALTKLPDESYDQFVARAAQNPLAKQVKLADLRDNSNLSRLPKITDKDLERTAKYQKSIRFLQNNLA